MKCLLDYKPTFTTLTIVFILKGLSVLAQQEVVIDSYPPVTTVEQGESIVLVCRVVGVLPSVTLSYSWTCNGGTCMGTEVVSGNRLRISVLNTGNHEGTFKCSVTGSGVTLSGAFSLTVNDGLALSAGGTNVLDYFIPRDSFITDSSLLTSSAHGNSTVVACRRNDGNPMWYYPNGTVVTNDAAVDVYQTITSNSERAELTINNISRFNNGDYTCNSTSISAVLGLYVMPGDTSLDPATSLMLCDVNTTSIVVMWSGAGPPVNGYYISWRRTDLRDSATAEYARVTGVMHMLTNLSAGVTYDITVWSTDGTQVSSPVSRQVTTSESAPTAPRLLRVVDSSSCQLDWLPPSQPNGAVTYTVQYQTSGSFMDLTTGLTTTHHSVVNLPSGTSVTVRVQAVNTAGTSTSNTIALPIPRPVSPMAVLTSTNTITVSWSAPTGMTCPPIDDYIVVYNNGSGNMTALTTGLALTLPNLQHGTTYSLFVAARSEGVSGVSVATSPPTITTLLAAPPPVAVVNTPQAVNSTSVMVSWSPADNPVIGTVTGYQLTVVILRATDNTTHSNVTVDGGSTSRVLVSLDPGVPYFVEVRVIESVRGLGLPRASSVFFSQETDADPTTRVSDLNYDSKSRFLSWRPIPLIDAHHFFSYLLTFTPRSQDCGQNPPTRNVRYTHCNDTCLVQLNLTCNAGYTVTVTISGSANPGVSTLITTPVPPTSTDNSSIPDCNHVLTGVISGAVTGVVVAIVTGSGTAILMYFIMKKVQVVKSTSGNNVEAHVYDFPNPLEGEFELTRNPSYACGDQESADNDYI